MPSRDFWFTFGPLFLVNGYVIVAFIVFSFIYKKLPKSAEVENRHSSVILNKWIREFWMWLTAPIFKVLLHYRVSPNALSIVGTLLALSSGVAMALGWVGLCGWFMVMGASFDFFDGRMARLTNRKTEAGSFIDSSLDRISEGLTLTGIAYYYKDSPMFLVTMLVYLGSMLTSYAKAKGESMGVEYAGGMMQRPERLAYLGAGAILVPMVSYLVFPWARLWFPTLTVSSLTALLYALPLSFVAVFCCAASAHRVINVMKLLDKKRS